MSTRLFLNLAITAMLLSGAMHSGTANNANLHAIPNGSSGKSIFDVFAQKEMLKVNLRTDLVHLIENRKKDLDQAATLTYVNESGADVSYEIKISPRGKYRRRVCDFPPLKLKFPKSALASQGLSAHNDLKLVTHCIDDKALGNEQLQKEYLAYRLYNLLTDKSYRVKLLQITYEDSNSKVNKINRYAFLIEDTDEMAERLGGQECDQCMNPPQASLDAQSERLMAGFQYMIGNADWSLQMGRNLKVVQPVAGLSTLVPYDFDFTGLVSPSYARINTNLGLLRIRERIYMGFPATDEELWNTFNYMRSKRSEMVSEIMDFKLLSMAKRKEMVAYIDEFFEIVAQLESQRSSNLYEKLKKPSRFLNKEEEAPEIRVKSTANGM